VQKGIPVFPTFDRAAMVIYGLQRYRRFLQR